MAAANAAASWVCWISSPYTRPHATSLLGGASKPSKALLRLPPPRPSLAAFAVHRNNGAEFPPTATKTEFPEKSPQIDDGDEAEDDIDEDAIEALFSQLEEDLKNDNLSDDESDSEISEEDLAKLEQELVDALGDVDDDKFSDESSSNLDSRASSDDDEERPPKLKNWQFRRLASALKIGRRKTRIKSLAAELGLDRGLVLELLRNPPPNLLLMSASLPDKVVSTPSEVESKSVESPQTLVVNVKEPETEGVVPVHVMQTRWSMQKRLKKVHVETLERVYSRSKRPTNTMVGSIVHVTNLPRRTVVKWFEDKRSQDGVPEHRQAFRRSVPN